MASWSDFATAEPELASAIRALLQQYGPGMGYLATVRADGGPRVHPVSPVITDEGLYCFIVNSAKRTDLERDGRYALHTYPPEESDDEAYLTGHAHPVTDPAVITHLADALNASPAVDWRLFELTIDTAMLRRHGPAGALPLAMSLRFPPITLKWQSPSTLPSPPSPTTASLAPTTPTRPSTRTTAHNRAKPALATPAALAPVPAPGSASAPAPARSSAPDTNRPARKTPDRVTRTIPEPAAPASADRPIAQLTAHI
ncbi:hypothetical protein GCM10010435_64890 [Winogradskya consettensis]|uniref:Pyridoxamine 5'-phosphate oxidase N-terminal domain-containing protein n=1 Tax=Winogradskya consettensis TaxID=113560 RepID=A0A919SHW1_9ACTN|nr:hypothetical protein Aco04nite_29070 [Actinoplanes consettensis]